VSPRISPGSQGRLRVYSTCPQSKDVDAAEYAGRVADVARWSEEAGCHGILVYTDNGIVDPWLAAQKVIDATETLRPLVAVQPVYMSPYSVAKMVTTLAYLHGRAVDLNMLAGGFRNDLRALGDETPHDDRYNRTVEYTRIVSGLLAGESVTAEGRWYRVKNLRLIPPLPAELAPELTISGSSDAGLAAAEQIGAIAIRYPKPVEDEERESGLRPRGGMGVRVGVIARERADDAWRVARERFPEDRRGEIKHQLAMKVSDSSWHRELSAREQGGEDDASPYWLGPFNQGQTFCPYLVGSHERVGTELGRYVAAGFNTFILDIPPDREELEHTGVVFERARTQAA
jgi:alkanesulfonate monooxygenase